MGGCPTLTSKQYVNGPGCYLEQQPKNFGKYRRISLHTIFIVALCFQTLRGVVQVLRQATFVAVGVGVRARVGECG